MDKRDKNSSAREARDAGIINRLRAGDTQMEIAADLGLTNARISQIARANGIRLGQGFNPRPKRGAECYQWNGGQRMQNGYVAVLEPDHPRAHDGYVLLHILLAERALGRPLPPGAQVHHGTGKPTDNHCLVICEDQALHLLIHRRMRAKEACGNPNWLKCKFCKTWDDPSNLHVIRSRWVGAYHPACQKEYRRGRRTW